MSFRDEFAKAVMQGFAANPAVFASNGVNGWSLVNCASHPRANTEGDPIREQPGQ